jgi:hypothetical protein
MRKVNKPLAIKKFIDSDPLALAFVIEAMTKYAVEQLDAPAWEGYTLVNQDAWRGLSQAALDFVATGE